MVIVITGSTRGIGKAVALEFAPHASVLFLTARNENLLKEQAEFLSGNYPGLLIKTFAADLSDHSKVIQLSKFILQNTDQIDVLVNNAGTFLPGNILDENEGNFDLIMNTNLKSVYTLCRQLIPLMLQRKKGHIFNICSVASLKAYPNGGSYSISKFALYGLTQNLRYELMQDNIKVTAVIPGATWTDSWSGSGIDRERFMEAKDIALMMYQTTLLSQGAVVEDLVMRPQLGDI
ncbi:MAG: SDR family oxidoreductase [Saprospiraceae bacterium]|nr:SDR family oxidoreductase [Saprospiraceae bacterium]